MKSLNQIKDEYAISKKFHSWSDFCLKANDHMFAVAVDAIAAMYADYRTRFILNVNARTTIIGHNHFTDQAV
jgi:hypothetical protein